MRRLIETTEQAMLRDTATRLLHDRYGFAHRESVRVSRTGFDADIWASFGAMGWLGLPLPAHLGGCDGSMLDVALLMECFGAALVLEPYIPTVVGGGMALLAAGSVPQQVALLPRLAEGRLVVALAVAEPGGGDDHFTPATIARRDGPDYLLDGEKAVVMHAPQADLLVVSAREADGPGGISLFLVPCNAAGITQRGYATVDGRRAAEIALHGVRLGPQALLGGPGQGRRTLEHVVDACTVAYLGEAAGIVQGAVDLTAKYLTMREQFGRKLSSFQALRHRVAAMYVRKEEVRALCRQAAMIFAENPAGLEAREAISAAKIHVGRYGRQVCEEAIQLHGAVGIADEYIIGHYLKRMVTIDHLFGDADHHLDRFTASPRWFANEAGWQAG